MPNPFSLRTALSLAVVLVAQGVGVACAQEQTPVREPLTGSCECPYDKTNSGRNCGGNSSYSRDGGDQPICYVSDEAPGETPAPSLTIQDGSDSVHLQYGNPTAATTDPSKLTNLLLLKDEFAVSYNCDRGIPNWVSWQLNDSWLGDTERQDDFRPDSSLPANCPAVTPRDYRGSGYDRGHVIPSGDRTRNARANSSTFVMANMVPQSPANNREVWRELETYSRELVEQGKELHIIAGGVGSLKRIGSKVTVPAQTWKIILVLDGPGATVNQNTRVIAIRLPNNESVANTSWQDYRVSVDSLEAVTGYDFLSKLPATVEAVLESRVDS